MPLRQEACGDFSPHARLGSGVSGEVFSAVIKGHPAVGVLDNNPPPGLPCGFASGPGCSAGFAFGPPHPL